MQIIFVVWVVFMEVLSSRNNFSNLIIDFHHTACLRFLFLKLPGHDLRDIIIGELNLILQQPGSYDLSTLTFSNYESIHTGKALVGIFPVEMRLKFRKIYPV